MGVISENMHDGSYRVKLKDKSILVVMRLNLDFVVPKQDVRVVDRVHLGSYYAKAGKILQWRWANDVHCKIYVQVRWDNGTESGEIPLEYCSYDGLPRMGVIVNSFTNDEQRISMLRYQAEMNDSGTIWYVNRYETMPYDEGNDEAGVDP